jgi:restriction system protein
MGEPDGRLTETSAHHPCAFGPTEGISKKVVGKAVMEGLLVIAILVVIVGGASFLQSHERRRAKAMRYFIAGHEQALAKKRRQLVQRDAYGNENIQKWLKEKKYFINTALIPHLSNLGYSFDKKEMKQLYPSFDAAIEHVARRALPASSAITDIATGHDYEHFCARLLSKNGFYPSVTKASGDQGVDIIADCNGLSVVFQCKFSTSPVGNKAVQEVVAARIHEQADLAVVISNTTYTKSAEALAGTTGTILINHDEIHNLRELIRRTIK